MGPAQTLQTRNPFKPSDVVLRFCHVFKCFTKPKSDTSHCVIWFGYYRICMSCLDMEMLSVSQVFRVAVFM